MANQKAFRDPLVVRQIVDTDAEALAELFAENNKPEIIRHFNPFPLTREVAWRIAVNTSLDRYYIALLDERIVGMCMLRGWEEGFIVPSFGVIISARFQGLGIGRKMTEFAIAQARSTGCKSMRLSVYRSNERALKLYLSLGFAEIESVKINMCGVVDERVVMLKDLQ